MSGSNLMTGAVAGFVATAPMTLSMEVMHRVLPPHQRYPLPPKQITTQVAQLTGIKMPFPTSKWDPLTMASHFSYGAATGSLYSLIANKLPLPPLISGPIYGLTVWAISYLGLLPLLRMLRPATKHPRERNIVMIVAHLVWGFGLGLLVQLFQHKEAAQKPASQK